MKKLIKYGLMGVGGFVILLIGIGILGALAGAGGDTNSEVAGVQETPSTQEASQSPLAQIVDEVKQDDVPAEYKSALNQATSYSSTMNMSKMGVYDQLVSEYGGQFTPEAAQYAIDNVQADWNANALASARSYQDTMNMSPAAIRDQLVSEYGGKFTPEEADYAIQNL